MSVEQAAVEHVLAEQRLAKLAENALIRQNLAAQTLDPPVPAKIPLDARLKSLKRQKFYDYVAFWIFGLANNFAYVCMLSAAQDIMANHATSDQSSSSKNETIPVCQGLLQWHAFRIRALG
ncbi:Battenin [Aphelenchoides bicaudatus]|nr:Battenin [Aphelenchoides bicaudatus]